MSKKVDRRPVADSPDSSSPASYRVVVRTIKVRGEIWRRSLADVLADPPQFPALTIPDQNEEPGDNPQQQIARGAGHGT
jgi:hypothetical protein